VGTSEFEIRIAYKSPRGIHRATYTSGKYMPIIDMELFIISARGVSPRAMIWTMEKKEFLTSMMLIAAGIRKKTASTVRNVLAKGRHEAELVWMSLPRPGAGRRTTTERQKDGQMETIGRNEVNKSSMKDLEDWDIVDNSTGLAKLQHKLQQIM